MKVAEKRLLHWRPQIPGA